MSNTASVQASAGISWAEIDAKCDWIPVVSLITNLVNVFFKCFVLRACSAESIAASPTYTYMDKKSMGRCVAFMLFSTFAKIFFWMFETPAESNPPKGISGGDSTTSFEHKVPLSDAAMNRSSGSPSSSSLPRDPKIDSLLKEMSEGMDFNAFMDKLKLFAHDREAMCTFGRESRNALLLSAQWNEGLWNLLQGVFQSSDSSLHLFKDSFLEGPSRQRWDESRLTEQEIACCTSKLLEWPGISLNFQAFLETARDAARSQKVKKQLLQDFDSHAQMLERSPRLLGLLRLPEYEPLWQDPEIQDRLLGYYKELSNLEDFACMVPALQRAGRKREASILLAPTFLTQLFNAVRERQIERQAFNVILAKLSVEVRSQCKQYNSRFPDVVVGKEMTAKFASDAYQATIQAIKDKNLVWVDPDCSVIDEIINRAPHAAVDLIPQIELGAEWVVESKHHNPPALREQVKMSRIAEAVRGLSASQQQELWRALKSCNDDAVTFWKRSLGFPPSSTTSSANASDTAALQQTNRSQSKAATPAPSQTSSASSSSSASATPSPNPVGAGPQPAPLPG